MLVVSELAMGVSAMQLVDLMSIALVHHGWMLLVTTLCAVLLSVWMGVGGYLWPISLSSRCMGIASHALM